MSSSPSFIFLVYYTTKQMADYEQYTRNIRLRGKV